MNLKKYFSKELMIFLAITTLIISIFSFILFGFTGVRIVLGIIIMWIPFCLILNNFDLTLGEKFVFSLILGITLFPSMVYLLGLLFSFRIAIVVTFVLLILVWFLISKFKKK